MPKAKVRPLDSRALMERAVEVMQDSIDEHRADGKTCPKVGAVLWRPDGRVETAFRGELGDGDHAEYTLLERKHHDQRLDDSVLFATLEPCAPGARRHPKLGCAERIVLTRIKRVWVGIEDPDPTVARKGIEHLRRHGVEVHMFDADLQERIQEANRQFLTGALQRATEATEAVRETTLSPLERAESAVESDDLDSNVLATYRKAAGIDAEAGSPAFYRELGRRGLMQEERGRLVPTGFDYLLFGKRPRSVMPQAGVLGTIEQADGEQEIRDFEGPQVLVPEAALSWLREKLPNPIDRSTAVRRESNAGFYELIREGLVNAIVHRDYTIVGAKIQLTISPETIMIRSPGRPVEPITVAQMESFDAPMLSRNPVLHYVFKQMGLAEERGLGLRSLKRRAQELGLPRPKYAWENPYLVFTLFRTPESAVRAISPGGAVRLTADDLAVWKLSGSLDSFTARDVADELGLHVRGVQRVLGRLEGAGLVRRTGLGRATRYHGIR